MPIIQIILLISLALSILDCIIMYFGLDIFNDISDSQTDFDLYSVLLMFIPLFNIILLFGFNFLLIQYFVSKIKIPNIVFKKHK